MKRMLVVVAVLSVAVVGHGASQKTRALRQQLKIQQTIFDTALQELANHQESMREAWVRVDREAADHLRAQEQGESTESLRLRDLDLREAEASLLMHLLEAERLRRALIASLQLIEETEEEIAQLEQGTGEVADPLSGTWDIIVEPGNQEGEIFLELDGTLVQGTYVLDGGWSGSLRGTLVSGKVRLERIDAQVGFAAILYGRLEFVGGSVRLVGRWEATQLAAGLPSAGSWIAERVEEE